MEEQESIIYVVIIFSSLLLLLAISFIVFIIIQKRKQHALEIINKVLDNQNNKEITVLKDDVEQLKRELENINSKLRNQIQ